MMTDAASPGRKGKMLAIVTARALAARGVHYGWLMVALTFLFGVCSAGAMSIPGILLTPISNDLGWSIGELSGPLGLRMTLFGLVAPFAGALILLHGPRKVLTWSAILLIAGLLVAITMTSRWQLWIALGIAMGVAPGMTALVMATTISTRWFTARRGLVLGILSAGNATGQLVFLMPATWIAQTYGWRMALVPSVFMLGILALLVVLLAIDRPADIGLAPYGEDTALAEPTRPPGNAFVISINALRWPRLAGVLDFGHHLFHVRRVKLRPDAAFRDVVRGFRHQPDDIHEPARCDRGVRSAWHCRLWLAIGPVRQSLAARRILRVPRPVADMVAVQRVFAGRAVVLRDVLRARLHRNRAPTVRLTAQAFGREQAPLVFGWIYAAHQLGAGLMAFAAGISRDVLASYLPVFFAAGVFCIVSALSLWFLKGRGGPVILAPRSA